MAKNLRALRRRQLLRGCAAAAFGVGFAGTAHAGCAPYPTTANTTTICDGANAGGLVLSATGANLQIASGASVTGAGTAPAITVASDSSYTPFYGNELYLIANGNVSGGSAAGVLVQNGAVAGETYPGTYAHIDVGQGVRVSGSTGILLSASPGNNAGPLFVTLDNSGTITSASGPAIRLTSPPPSGYAGFESIVNEASGVIDGIDSDAASITNAGTIAGGSTSAIHGGMSDLYLNSTNPVVPGVTNTGTIVSTSADPTINGQVLITNSGAIDNRGNGLVLSADFIHLTNAAGGVIQTAGRTAISTGQLLLVNRGTIDGSIAVTPPQFGAEASSIDSVGGRIEGDVTLGSEDDTVYASLSGSALETGISGTLAAGGGTNTIRVDLRQDTTLSAPINLPSGFNQLALGFFDGATVALAPGFALGAPLLLTGDGPGSLVNNTDLTSQGAVFSLSYPGPSLAFTNNGSITSTLAHSYDVALPFSTGSGSFTNTGVITARGGGALYMSAPGTFTNTGTITATDTAVSLFATPFTNSGTISSTAGTGLEFTQSSAVTTDLNSGLIEGAASGAAISNDLFHNSGTIRSPEVGVTLGYFGGVFNDAGGTISGGTYAITGTGGATSNATVVNAGTISGDVDLGSAARSDAYNDSRNIYDALTGGVLNGNLALGSGGDTFITDLVNTGSGAYAGVTGTVSGHGFETVRYRVGADATATLGADPSGTFGAIGYELSDNARLTLAANAPISTSLLLAGAGTVDLTADITQTDHTVIGTAAAYIISPEDIGTDTSALTITSHGALTFIKSANATPEAAVTLGSGDSFVNAGTIRSSAADLSQTYVAGVLGGASVTNSGTISTAGGYGILEAAQVTNSGSILQIAGGADTVGIASTGNVLNTGTIETGGVALQLGSEGETLTSVDNSGVVASAHASAILSPYTAIAVNNRTGGRIIGGVGFDAISAGIGSIVVNAGTIDGDVDLGTGSYDGSPSIYVSDGGTLNGGLSFGSGNAVFVQRGASTGVTGAISLGGATNTFVRSYATSQTVQGDAALPSGFTMSGVEALGADTVVTVTAGPAGSIAPTLFYGEGAIIDQIDAAGISPTVVTLGGPVGTETGSGLAFTNTASLAGGVQGSARSFTNTGSISGTPGGNQAVLLQPIGGTTFTFDNSGSIDAAAAEGGVVVASEGYETAAPISATVTNSGSVTGGFTASFDTPTLTFANSGTITASADRNSGTFVDGYRGQGSADTDVAINATNSGTIGVTGAGATALAITAEHYNDGAPTGAAITFTNSGTLSSSGNSAPVGPIAIMPSVGLSISAEANATITVTNTAAGAITATGSGGSAIIASSAGGQFTLNNSGTITGDTGNVTPGAGAITVDGATSMITNSGTITGSILLADGADSITNSGRIDGSVSMGGGDDRFTELAGGAVTGTVDGGDGINALFVDTSPSSGGGVDLSHFTRFQSISVTGAGSVALSGALAVPTVQLAGGTVEVAAGTTLTTTSATTITGSDGADTVINNGTIAGAVALGAGDDNFTEGPGSRVAGGVDGGAGFDTYHIVLAGDRSGIGARSNFEALSVEGTGTLGLTLDQDFSTILLAGTGLDLALAGHSVGSIMGGGGANALTLDGDVARVSLGGGDDSLKLTGTGFAGHYDGGAGTDSVRFTTTAPMTLSGSIANFEQISFATSALTLSGALGDADSAITFDDSGHQLIVTSTGTLSGLVSLGNGANLFQLAAGGVLAGMVAGGTGFDEADLDLAGDRTLAGATLQGFDLLKTTGSGNLIFGSGAGAFGRMTLSGGLTIAAGASLAAGQVQFGGGDDNFTIAGGFTGSVDGGSGRNRLVVTGGSEATPVAFGQIANFNTFAQSDGFVTLAGTAQVGGLTMTGGRLIGLAGSVLIAPGGISVASGATFGSEGTVVGDVTIGGTLSPGASPGTMTVQGNVALQTGSHSLFELTTGISDHLHATGAITIANGATLDLTGARPLTPGTALDLVIADGGITGTFTTINQSSTIFGFLRQTVDSIELVGQFANTGFRPQVSATIDYVNALLTGGDASPALIAAAPSLLTSGGATNGGAFARLNPEAYASAMQIGIENGLSLAKAARSGVAVNPSAAPGLFSFAQGLGGWRTLGGDNALGTSQARLQSHGELGGVGYGSARASLAAFVGYMKANERIAALGAHTDASDTVAGVIGHLGLGGFDMSALLAYDGGRASLRRTLIGDTTIGSRFGLRSWVGDIQVGYALRLGQGWALKPQAGFTYVGEHRDAANESGSAFALAVAADHQHAAFADGSLALEGGLDADAKVHPWLSGGIRRQMSGERTTASASFVAASTNFAVAGAGRSRTLATAAAGLGVDLSRNVSLFVSYNGEFGRNSDGEGVNGGLKMRF